MFFAAITPIERRGLRTIFSAHRPLKTPHGAQFVDRGGKLFLRSLHDQMEVEVDETNKKGYLLALRALRLPTITPGPLLTGTSPTRFTSNIIGDGTHFRMIRQLFADMSEPGANPGHVLLAAARK